MLVLAACGGAQPAPGPAPAGSSGPQAAQADAKAEKARAPSCTEGSCFPCGDGICLPGSYCESDKGKQGCAWSPKCATRATCACLAPMLKAESGCRCEERQGGVYVACD